MSLFASILPVIPNSLGIENPQISASKSPVWNPFFAKPNAIFADKVDFPTPPFPLPIAITLVLGSTFVGCAFSLAFSLAFSITAVRSFWSIAVIAISTVSTFSKSFSFLLISVSIWFLIGQSAIVRANLIVTVLSTCWTSLTMPNSTIFAPNSGSNTVERCFKRISLWVITVF